MIVYFGLQARLEIEALQNMNKSQTPRSCLMIVNKSLPPPSSSQDSTKCRNGSGFLRLMLAKGPAFRCLQLSVTRPAPRHTSTTSKGASMSQTSHCFVTAVRPCRLAASGGGGHVAHERLTFCSFDNNSWDIAETQGRYNHKVFFFFSGSQGFCSAPGLLSFDPPLPAHQSAYDGEY